MGELEMKYFSYMTTGFLLLAFAAPTLGFSEEAMKQMPSAPSVTSETAPQKMKIDEIQKNVSSLSGHQVSTTGKVKKVIGPNAFIMQGKSGKDILLVTPAPMQKAGEAAGVAMPKVKKGDQLWFSGTVKELVISDVVDTYNLKRETFTEMSVTETIPVVEAMPSDIQVKS